MVCGELRVEQGEAAAAQPRHQMDQRYLAGIAGGREHALAEERAPQRYAVEAADQFIAAPDLDRVGMT
jgi:hypothetical protein